MGILTKLISFCYEIQGVKAEHKISALPSKVRQLLYNLLLVARGQFEKTSAETTSLNLGVGYLGGEIWEWYG